MASNIALQWFEAYLNAHELLKLRGYHPQAILTFPEFYALYSSWTQGGAPVKWFIFQHDEEPDMHLAFITSKIASDKSKGLDPKDVILYIESNKTALKAKAMKSGIPLDTLGRKQLTINCIIVTGALKNDVTNPAMQEFAQFAPKLLKRAELGEDFSPTLEVFTYEYLLINPTLFCLQPENIRLITDEAEKEDIRRDLLNGQENKDRTLEDLLPIARFGRPLSVWFGARVGDVFWFPRTAGGVTPYMRIVLPEPPTTENSKKAKKKVFADDESDF